MNSSLDNPLTKEELDALLIELPDILRELEQIAEPNFIQQ